MRLQPRYYPGDKIGGRHLVHQVKMGGMAEVYLCLDLETIQPYALKTFQQRYLTHRKLRPPPKAPTRPNPQTWPPGLTNVISLHQRGFDDRFQSSCVPAGGDHARRWARGSVSLNTWKINTYWGIV